MWSCNRTNSQTTLSWREENFRSVIHFVKMFLRQSATWIILAARPKNGVFQVSWITSKHIDSFRESVFHFRNSSSCLYFNYDVHTSATVWEDHIAIPNLRWLFKHQIYDEIRWPCRYLVQLHSPDDQTLKHAALYSLCIYLFLIRSIKKVSYVRRNSIVSN